MNRRALRTGLTLAAACLAAWLGASSLVDSPDTETDRTETSYERFAAVVARHQAMSERVAAISRRLRVANAPLCRVTRPDAGLSTHRLEDYPRPLRPLALHFMDLGEEGRFIRSVVPGSPADRAALHPGERVLSGWPLREDAALVTGSGPVALDPDEACVAPAFVIDSPVPNAGTDGREIALSTTLVDQAADEAALAFIIAHEMAHILRDHKPDGPRWMAELQADGDALTLMRNAGYDIAATVAGWEAGVEVHRESQSMSATHPPLDIRLENLTRTLARLEAQTGGFRTLDD
ncbi:M48 family metalloprotease [uncultured Algimonas sp.]|uniref:M48 family metalloprotease n=1 Tax=uncultured Algimonas sp. TaxID=1547920 RepID=UPI0026318C12|nr:M48 family metalloprotease [uncultured Algimonas sp.]